VPAIDEWLVSLGLGEYAPAFAENDIDFSILPDLTDQDLKELGIASLGHRRKMLRAIAELDGAATAAAPSPSPAAPAVASAPAAEAAGERRYLTVMFCDLVGSTGISAQLDAEEWRDLVGSYLDAASAAVTEMGGHVAKKLGDGLLALFGYPQAHENDAERAARAALAIQRALADLNRKNTGTGKSELAARVGLETGPAVVDAAGDIYGDVANIAARVQALAEPGAVLVTARVQRQIAGLFVAEERGTHALKGVPEPTALFRLIRASGGGRRSAQRNPTPLIGRDEEIAMLLRRWERAQGGDGQLVLIVGEPGLGKSRLIEEFHARLREVPHTWVEWSCSQLLQNTPLHPIAEWGRQRFGGADVPAERRLADLENSLAQVKLDPADTVPLVAPLLDIPLPKERMPALAPEELRRRQLAALTNWVMAGARAQPLVLAFEDLHWADPTTLDVLRGIAERGALAPLFIVATMRPEFRPPWGMRSHHGTISLAPLDRSQVRDMVGELSARHALSREVIEDVAARTGGVPLFVEEVTRLLLERGEQGGIQAIPPTLQQSLMARLDRLGGAREVAQIGAVIGRGFSYSLLRAVAALDDAPLQAALEKLADADIVLVQGLPPESDYRFKHALIQDAAYENLLKSRRQILHRRVAETLRDRFADTAVAEPEALAHHFTQAGMTDDAIEWWGKAGDQALRRSAFQEAIAHLGKAIAMADKSGETALRAATPASASSIQRLKLQTSYGQAMMWSKGYAAEETKAAFRRAQELGTSTDKSDERYITYYGQWGVNLLSTELSAAQETARLLLREAEPQTTEALAGHRLIALTSLCQGSFADARIHSEKALEIDDSAWHRDAKLRFGQDSRIAALCYLGLSRWTLGEVRSAREPIEKAITDAVESAHVPTLANTYYFAAMFDLFRGDAEVALRAAQATVELSREHALSLYLTVGNACVGWAHAHLGDRETGAAELRQALADLAERGNRLWLPLYQGLLAQIESDAGDVARASVTIDEALALVDQIGGYWAAALLYRIRGQILLKRDPMDTVPAEEAFLIGIAIAQRQNAKSFELQAALALAQLYQNTSRAADAHAVLAPALAGFSPTPEFPEIAESHALLAVLAETDEVKNASAARQRRLKLQTSYSQAVMWSKGFGAEETKAAFAHARKLADKVGPARERYAALYGQWANNFMRGEFGPAAQAAETILHAADNEGRKPEAVTARRMLGFTHLMQGELLDARGHLEQALVSYVPRWNGDDKFQLGPEPGLAAMAYLAWASWLLGDVERARELIEESVERAIELDHPPTLANNYTVNVILEVLRADAEAALRAGQNAIEVSSAHGLGNYLPLAMMCTGWARARLGDRTAGVDQLRQGLAAHTQTGNKTWLGWLQGALAELEGDGQSAEALAEVDEALALTSEIGERWSDAFLHRVRGEILLKRDAANTAPAEEAFLTAIAVAQQQQAKSFELRAALALAKLYQSTNRAVEAHAALASALECFSPTPEFPEIEQAQTLLAVLKQTSPSS